MLADASAQGVEKIAVLGDTIDYGPDPIPVLERAHAAADIFLLGNHEEEAVTLSEYQEESAVLGWTQPLLANHSLWQSLRAKIEADGAPAHAAHVSDSIHFTHASATRPTIQYVWPGHESQYVVFNSQIDERVRDFLSEFQRPHGFNGPHARAGVSHALRPPQDSSTRIRASSATTCTRSSVRHRSSSCPPSRASCTKSVA